VLDTTIRWGLALPSIRLEPWVFFFGKAFGWPGFGELPYMLTMGGFLLGGLGGADWGDLFFRADGGGSARPEVSECTTAAVAGVRRRKGAGVS